MLYLCRRVPLVTHGVPVKRFDPPHSYVVPTRRGFDARCYATRADDVNAIGETVDESSHRTLSAAVKAAKRFHKTYGGTIHVPET
jgi:hypothetical protein